MAGKTKDMSQIKQLLLLKKEGVSNRKAAEIVGINKETANNYVRKALADRLGIDGLLKLDDPVLEHRLKGGNPHTRTVASRCSRNCFHTSRRR